MGLYKYIKRLPIYKYINLQIGDLNNYIKTLHIMGLYKYVKWQIIKGCWHYHYYSSGYHQKVLFNPFVMISVKIFVSMVPVI